MCMSLEKIDKLYVDCVLKYGLRPPKLPSLEAEPEVEVAYKWYCEGCCKGIFYRVRHSFKNEELAPLLLKLLYLHHSFISVTKQFYDKNINRIEIIKDDNEYAKKVNIWHWDFSINGKRPYCYYGIIELPFHVYFEGGETNEVYLENVPEELEKIVLEEAVPMFKDAIGQIYKHWYGISFLIARVKDEKKPKTFKNFECEYIKNRLVFRVYL